MTPTERESAGRSLSRRLQFILVVAVGAAVGSVARYLVGIGSGSLFGTEFPWGTLLINVTGSFMVGAFIGLFATKWESIASWLARVFIVWAAMRSTGVLTIALAATSCRAHSRGAALGAAKPGQRQISLRYQGSCFGAPNQSDRRVAPVAYVGQDYADYIPSPRGVDVVCNPKPGATSATAVDDLRKAKASVRFSDKPHMKVYWSEGVITSYPGCCSGALMPHIRRGPCTLSFH
jgi:hypothetical protein